MSAFTLKKVAQFTTGVSIYKSIVLKGRFHVYKKGRPSSTIGDNLTFKEAVEYAHRLGNKIEGHKVEVVIYNECQVIDPKAINKMMVT